MNAVARCARVKWGMYKGTQHQANPRSPTVLWSFPVVIWENKVNSAKSLMPDVLLQLGAPLQHMESNNEIGINVDNLLLE